mgnify:FL=1
MEKHYIGIDLGGTFIKGGIIDLNGKVVYNTKTPTEVSKGSSAVVTNIANLIKTLAEKDGREVCSYKKVGIAVPGMIDDKAGVVVMAGNFGWKNFPLKQELEKLLPLEIIISNDANVAALGEAYFGAGAKYNDSVFITLGTGVGGGVIIDKKIFSGYRSAGAEIGHMIIAYDGEQCTCGNKGCFEAYSSATALIRDTKREMQSNKNSAMWNIGGLDKVDGKTAFDYYDCDKSAKKVVDNYITMLGVGLVNVANIFRPEVIMLGGGVCGQGEKLVKPLQEYLDKHIFAGDLGPHVPITIATLGNDAGFIGAAAMCKE